MLKIIVFIFDVFRFLVMTAILAKAGGAEQTGGSFFFPVFAYAAALALFPLMSFFLLRRDKKNKPFVYLYASGKTISICAVVSAVIFSIKSYLPITSFLAFKSLIVNMIFPFIAFMDILTVIIVILTNKNTEKEIKKNDGADSSGTA